MTGSFHERAGRGRCTFLRFFEVAADGVTVFCVCAFLILGTYVLRARVALGHWPSMYSPDPKELGFSFHHALVLPALAFSVTPLLFVAVVVGAKLTGAPSRWLRRHSAAFAVVYGMTWILGHLFVDWYLD